MELILSSYLKFKFRLLCVYLNQFNLIQIDLAHDGPQNGYSSVTWIPAQHLKSMPNHHQQEQRMAPIVCTKESVSSKM